MSTQNIFSAYVDHPIYGEEHDTESGNRAAASTKG